MLSPSKHNAFSSQYCAIINSYVCRRARNLVWDLTVVADSDARDGLDPDPTLTPIRDFEPEPSAL